MSDRRIEHLNKRDALARKYILEAHNEAEAYGSNADRWNALLRRAAAGGQRVVGRALSGLFV